MLKPKMNPKMIVNFNHLPCSIAALNAPTRGSRAGKVALALSILLLGTGLPACGEDKGDTGSDGGADCEALCSKPRPCPNDGDKTSCLQECNALASSCSSEAKALNSCTIGRPETDFECDEAGKTKLKDGICQAETQTLFGCVFGDVPAGGQLPGANSSEEATPSGSEPSSESSGAGVPPSPPGNPVPAPGAPPSNGEAIDCGKTCAALQQVGCQQTEAECNAECTESMAALAMTSCVSAYVALEQCAEADIANNFECLDGSPSIKESACSSEQGALLDCAFSDGLGGDTSEACTTFCATSTFDPPVTCDGQAALPCQTNCDLVLALFGETCSQVLLDYTGCTTKADASHWSCVADGTAEFDGELCQAEMEAMNNCVLGAP